MPLTEFQRRVLGVIGRSRAPESYLAGGTALHIAPNSTRYSHDLDLFHDAVEQVAEAFDQDRDLLEGHGYELEVTLSQPGFIRAVVKRDGESTRIDWARDSAWRFVPVIEDELGGYLLHPVDLATNKVLALAGRDEVRDFVDILYVMDHILPLGAVVWAAVAKDPGFTPLSLLEQLKRRGRPRPEEVDRLDLAQPFDLKVAKERWLRALEDADAFIRSRPAEEAGCLYFSEERQRFEAPAADIPLSDQGLATHYGRVGGVLPRPTDQDLSSHEPRSPQ